MTSGTNQASLLVNADSVDISNTVKLLRNSQGIAIQFFNGTECRELRCSRANGGRITSFSLNGEEILVSPNPSGMFGSTFWTSPENWGWPPPVAIDDAGYSMDVNSRTGEVTLGGPSDSNLNVRIEKRFRVSQNGEAIHVTYTTINESNSPQCFAPWEISRVEKGGITFYRKGSTPVTAKNRGIMNVEQEDDIVAYRHPFDMKEDAKLFDSSADGWIAHTNGRLLFIKEFEPATPIAPGEGEIEIYACPGYVEVEQQGTYAQIPGGKSASWQVTWSLYRLPEATSLHSPRSLAQTVDHILANR